MKIFVFERQEPKIKWKTFLESIFPEPIIIHDFSMKSIYIVFFVWLSILIWIYVFLRWSSKELETKKDIPGYGVCYNRESQSYYDKELDLVFIKDWYKYCDKIPYTTWNIEKHNLYTWSCFDTWCFFPKTQEEIDKEFDDLVWKRYFLEW